MRRASRKAHPDRSSSQKLRQRFPERADHRASADGAGAVMVLVVEGSNGPPTITCATSKFIALRADKNAKDVVRE